METERQEKGFAAMWAGVFGVCVGISLFMCAVVLRLHPLAPPIRFYAAMLVLAALTSVPPLYFLLAYKKVRRHWRVAFCSALAMFALVGAWSGYQYYEYRNSVLTDNAAYQRSVVAMVHANHFPMPEKLQDWRFWYWSLFPAPFGGGSRYFALPGPDGKCTILSNPATWPLSLVVDVYPIAPGTRNRDPDAWARGTLAHELTHCFDANADSNADYTKRTSLPPYLADQPREVVEQAITAKRLDVTAWKEAVADIVQVGYWRLTENDRRHADSLASDLKTDAKPERGARILISNTQPFAGSMRLRASQTPRVWNRYLLGLTIFVCEPT